MALIQSNSLLKIQSLNIIQILGDVETIEMLLIASLPAAPIILSLQMSVDRGASTYGQERVVCTLSVHSLYTVCTLTVQ